MSYSTIQRREFEIEQFYSSYITLASLKVTPFENSVMVAYSILRTAFYEEEGYHNVRSDLESNRSFLIIGQCYLPKLLIEEMRSL